MASIVTLDGRLHTLHMASMVNLIRGVEVM